MSLRLIRIVFIVTIILLLPLIAMQFTNEVSWGFSDFILMGSALISIGVLYELVAKKSKKPLYRFAFGIGLFGAFCLFWVNSAVGIIGSENQNVNLLYGIVIVVGFIGSIISRFKPKGMSNTLFATALTQMLIPLVVFLIWPPPKISWSPSIFGVFFLSSFFSLIFLVSAILFRKSITKN
jgi:hypothetical protein